MTPSGGRPTLDPRSHPPRGTPMSLHDTGRSAFPPGEPARPHHPPRPENHLRFRPLPPYKVILHHDGASELMFVVRTVMELTRLCRAEATQKMWETYHYGRSLLLVTNKERAELYVEQFASKGLLTSIEPA